MSVEPLKKLLKLWEREDITQVQVIGKILVLLSEHHKRLLKLEATPRRVDNAVR